MHIPIFSSSFYHIVVACHDFLLDFPDFPPVLFSDHRNIPPGVILLQGPGRRYKNYIRIQRISENTCDPSELLNIRFYRLLFTKVISRLCHHPGRLNALDLNYFFIRPGILIVGYFSIFCFQNMHITCVIKINKCPYKLSCTFQFTTEFNSPSTLCSSRTIKVCVQGNLSMVICVYEHSFNNIFLNDCQRM